MASLPPTESHKAPQAAQERRRRLEALRKRETEDPEVQAQPEVIGEEPALEEAPETAVEETPASQPQPRASRASGPPADWFENRPTQKIILVTPLIKTVLRPVHLEITDNHLLFILPGKIDDVIELTPYQDYIFRCDGKDYTVCNLHPGVILPCPVPYTLFCFAPVQPQEGKPTP